MSLAGGTRAQSDLSAVMGHGALASVLWGHRTPASTRGWFERIYLSSWDERACLCVPWLDDSILVENSKLVDGKVFPACVSELVIMKDTT